jgi:hypothetical protein
LGNGFVVRARLAQRLAIQVSHLVGADHNGVREHLCNRLRFGLRQSLCQRSWMFTVAGRFIDIWRLNSERQPQSSKQFLAVSRS